MKPNDSYFNNQDKSLNQNLNIINPMNNSSNLRMNLNNLMNNSNNKNLPNPVSTGNLIGHAEKKNANFNLNRNSSKILNQRVTNEPNNNLNQVGFVSKFINSYK